MQCPNAFETLGLLFRILKHYMLCSSCRTPWPGHQVDLNMDLVHKKTEDRSIWKCFSRINYKEKRDLLIGPLKLFLFLQITVHILKHSALRNPFVPAGMNTKKINQSIKHLRKVHCANHIYFYSFKHLLLIPTTVMNKVFDLFIFDVYFNTLQRERERH